MLEEVIDRETEGPFRKYINNASAVTLALEDPEDQERADFLTFVQHYQMLKSHGTLFVSDYQGGSSLLIDPQIMTSPKALDSRLFADGNIGKGFESFHTDHICNHFCNFFELGDDFKAGLPSKMAEDIDGEKSMSISVAE
ncbi:hypothetical protein R3P38DRAFT_3184742 [Favolaschia claudopus]